MVPVKQLVYDDIMDFILLDVNDVLWLDVWHSIWNSVAETDVSLLVRAQFLDTE
jgi:hypothetical protein